MTESEAIVVRLEGGDAWVEVKGSANCGSCERVGGCGAGETRAQLQRVPNSAGARVGDSVVLRVPSGAILKAALWSYLLPLALALVGAASGLTLGGDALSVLGTLGGLAIGWLVLRRANGRLLASAEPLLTMGIKSSRIHAVQLHRDYTS